MKRYLILCIVAVCLVCSGCGKAAEINNKYNVSEDDFTGTNEFWINNGVIAETTDGFYYNNSGFLYFYDKKLKESVIVCGKPNCRHEAFSCSAFFSGSVYSYKDNIYLLDDSQLFTMNRNAGERKSIANEISTDDIIDVVFNNGCMYYIECYKKDNNEKTKINKINLESGKKEVVYDYNEDNTEQISKLKCVGDKLYFTIKYPEKSEDNTTKVVSRGVFTFDEENNRILNVIDDNIFDFVVDEANKKIYYFAIGDGAYMYDVHEKTNKKFFEADEQTSMCSMYFDGTNIFIDNSLWKIYAKGFMKLDTKISYVTRCFDLDGQLKGVINMEEKGCNGACYESSDILVFRCTGENKFQYIEKDNMFSEEWKLF